MLLFQPVWDKVELEKVEHTVEKKPTTKTAQSATNDCWIVSKFIIVGK